MDSADTSLGFTDTTTAVLRELRGERRGATAGPDPADHFVSSGDGSPFFAHHLRRLREASPAAGPHAEPIRQDDGPDSYFSRQAPGIVRRTFEASSGTGAAAESARGLQEEPKSR